VHLGGLHSFYSCCSLWSIRHPWNASFHFSFLIFRQPAGLHGRGISPSQCCYQTQTQNKRGQTAIPRVGFETTTLVFERAKTVHALDRAATVIGLRGLLRIKWKNLQLRINGKFSKLTFLQSSLNRQHKGFASIQIFANKVLFRNVWETQWKYSRHNRKMKRYELICKSLNYGGGGVSSLIKNPPAKM
jgi:hypothetical protein